MNNEFSSKCELNELERNLLYINVIPNHSIEFFEHKKWNILFKKFSKDQSLIFENLRIPVWFISIIGATVDVAIVKQGGLS